MHDISIPWYVCLGGLAAVLVYIAAKEGEIQNDLNKRLREISNSINELKDLILSVVVIDGHNATWIEMVQTISSFLGEVYTILSAVKGQVMEDPTLYESPLGVEWASVLEDSNEILDSRGVDTSPPKYAANSRSVALVVRRRSLIAPTSDVKARVVEALAALGKLDTTMTSQVDEAKSFFAKMEKLLQSPYLSSIVGY